MRVTLSMPEDLRTEIEALARRENRFLGQQMLFMLRSYLAGVQRGAGQGDAEMHTEYTPMHSDYTPTHSEYTPTHHESTATHADYTEMHTDYTDTHQSADWELQAAEADALPEDDNWRTPTSQSRVRREAQVKVLQAAFGEMFPQSGALQLTTAKKFLQESGNSAAAVIEAMQYTAPVLKNPQAARSYISKVLVERKAKPKPGRSEGGFVYTEMSDEERYWTEVAKAEARRRGWGDHDDAADD